MVAEVTVNRTSTDTMIKKINSDNILVVFYKTGSYLMNNIKFVFGYKTGLQICLHGFTHCFFSYHVTSGGLLRCILNLGA